MRHKEETNEEKIDEMIDYNADTDDVQKFIKKIEGTDDFWYFIAKLFSKTQEAHIELDNLKQRVKELEEINENMSNSFRKKNEYGY